MFLRRRSIHLACRSTLLGLLALLTLGAVSAMASDLTVTSGTTTAVRTVGGSSVTYAATASDATVDPADIAADMAAGRSVLLQTSSGSGRIIVSQPITGATRTLTLLASAAGGGVTIDAPIESASASTVVIYGDSNDVNASLGTAAHPTGGVTVSDGAGGSSGNLQLGASVYGAAGSVSLHQATTLDAAGVSITAAVVDLVGTLDGAQDLTLNGYITADASIGGTTALSSLTVNGSFIQTTAGSVTTTGAQTFGSGGTYVAGNTTFTAGGALTFNGPLDGPFAVTLAGNGAIHLPTAGVGGDDTPTSLTVSAGTGALDLRGDVTTTGPQTYSRPVAVSAASTLTSIGNASLSFASSGPLDGPGALTVVTDGSVSLPNATGSTTPLASFTSSGSGFVLSPSIFNIPFSTAGSLSTTGAISIAGSYGGGLITSTAGGLTVGGTTSLSGNFITSGLISVAQASTLSGSLSASGSGFLTKAGVGTLRLAAASNSVTGATTVAAGGLRVDGTGVGAVNLGGGTLSGTGTVGAVTGNASTSQLLPGAGGGVLHTGNLSLGTGDSVTITPTGSGASSLAVVGTVALGNAILEPLGSTPLAPNASVTILANDGSDAITGTFRNLPEGTTFTLAGVPVAISYVGGDGNDVTLTRVKAASATTLASSAASVTVGTAVTFTATVTGSGPTGTVDFLDGSTVIGTGTLTDGAAAITTSTLAVGDHSITASYAGDGANLASVSAATVQHVTAAVITPPVAPPVTPPVTPPVVPAPADTVRPGVTIGIAAKAVVSKSGTIRVTFSCPKTETSCTTQFFLTSSLNFSTLRPKVRNVVAKTVKLAGGKSTTVTIKLPANVRAAIAKRPVRFVVRQRTTDAAGNLTLLKRVVLLRHA